MSKSQQKLLDIIVYTKKILLFTLCPPPWIVDISRIRYDKEELAPEFLVGKTTVNDSFLSVQVLTFKLVVNHYFVCIAL